MNKQNKALTESMPLTLPQLEIWIAQTIYADLPIYNIAGYIPIQAKIDSERFEQAVISLVQQHDALRIMLTQPKSDDGLPRQHIQSSFPVPFQIWDFSKEKKPHHFALDWMRQRCDEPFTLYASPLFRFDLIKVSDNCWYFFNRHHHILMDGESHPLIYQTLAKLYTQSSVEPSEQSVYSYTAYIEDDLAYRISKRYARDAVYWQKQCATPSELLLQPQHSLLTKAPLANAREILILSRERYQALYALAERLDATFLSLLSSVLYVYFNRTSQKNALTIALAVHNRSYTKFKKTVGLFAKVLPLWFDFDVDLNFDELVKKAHCRIKEHLRHHRYPATQRITKQNLAPFSAGFDVSLSYMTGDRNINFSDNQTQPIPLQQDYRLTPLSIQIYIPPVAENIELECTYNQAYFSKQDIRLLVRRLDVLLESVITIPSSKANDLPLCDEEEWKQVLQWGQGAINSVPYTSIIELFNQQVSQHPDAIAICFEEQQLSYQQLNQQANRVAHQLIALGVQSESLLGLCLERSPQMIIGLLAILKAGGAYVPIDPDYPIARIQFMLKDSDLTLLLTQKNLLAPLPEPIGLERLDIHQLLACSDIAESNPALAIDAHQLAYVIYTSGSTGIPKGVMVEHQGIVRLINQSDYILLDQQTRMLQVASISFDAATLEIWGSLCNGGQLIIQPPGIFSLHEIAQTIQQQQVNTLWLSAGVFHQMVDMELSALSSIKQLIAGGDILSPAHSHKLLQQYPDCQLINGYGPSENTTFTSCHKIQKQDTLNTHIPIGKPINATQLYILDAQGQPLPPGIPGELYIGGLGLARGYLNREQLTAERFVELEVFGKQQRLYRSGDKVRWNAEGALEFLGRLDHQIKLRGYRIELGEIESALRAQAQISEALVLVKGEGEEKQLNAYVVAAQEERMPADFGEALKAALTEQLPQYMIPQAIMILDAFPLTPNGKIDRQALPVLTFSASANFSYTVTPTEELLATLWSQLLNCEVVSRNDNFFALGGHSLLATILIARIRETFKVELAIHTVFEHPELFALATAIDTKDGNFVLPLIEKQSLDAPKVLSLGQERFWFLNQYDSHGSAHIMSYAWKLQGQLDLKALRETFCALVTRHQSLHLSFPQVNKEPTVAVLAPYDPLVLIDLSTSPDDKHEQELAELFNNTINKAFSLESEALFRVYLVKLANQNFVIFLAIHHIIFDDWSMNQLLQEWQFLYTAYQQQTPQLSEPPIQYTDYAAWQRSCLQGEFLQQQLNYWTQQLDAAPELLKLFTDFPRPKTQQNIGGIVALNIPKGLADKLRLLARQQNCTLHMVLFSCFVLLLKRYSGQQDICVGIPLVMRHHQQTENLLGLFLNILVLRTQVSAQETFIELLEQVRQNALDAYEHQDIPFEYLLKHLRPQRQTAYNPYFQVMFNLVNTSNNTHFELPNLHIESWKNTRETIATSNLDIVFTLKESITGIEGNILFDKGLFKAETITEWSEEFTWLLEQAVTEPATILSQFTPAQNTKVRYPLASAQREIWFEQMLYGESSSLHNIGGAVKIPGTIDIRLFEQAANFLVQKHDTLRTRLLKTCDEDGIPLQTYVKPSAFKIPVHDFSKQSNEAIEKWMQARFEEPFKLTEAPLFRYDLIKTSQEHYYWLIQYHHLIVDGYAIALLNRSMGGIYSQLVNRESVNLDSLSYVDFIHNDRRYIESKTFSNQKHYWLEQYPTIPEPLFTPRYQLQYTDKLIGSRCEALYLPRDFYNRLNALAKQHQASLFHLLLGALYVYFTRTAQRDDFAIGLPVLNRANANFKNTAGLFTGISPALFNFGKELSFAQLLQQISKTLKANYRHQRLPISEINRLVGSRGERSQLFDISLSYENHDNDACFAGIDTNLTLMLNHEAQTPLTIFVRDFHVNQAVKFDFVFNLAYFNNADIKALQARVVSLLDAILIDNLSPVNHLPILTQREHQWLQTCSQPKTTELQDNTLVHLFEQHAEKTPDSVAVVFAEQSLTYSQLNTQANQLAHYLLGMKTQQGEPLLQHNNLIAIAVERSLDMLIGLLAILKSGQAYVPIDPDYPAARIHYILENSAAPLLLTQSHLIQQLNLAELPNSPSVLCLDTARAPNQSEHNPQITVQAQDLAYVIYTSGSTGLPKGVMVEHRGVIRLIHQPDYIQLDKHTRMLQVASISFDAATLEIWGPLCNGGQLIIQPPGIFSPHEIAQTIQQQQVNTFMLPTGIFHQIVDMELDALAWARQLVVGGDILSPIHTQKLLQRYPDCQLINAYGPTENTMISSSHKVQLSDHIKQNIPIGQPINATQLYILDAQGQLLPPGISGELYIGGLGLARGYLNREQLTTERFIELEVFGAKQRLYRSGDKVRWNAEGNLEFLGRLDHQIKLRGYRIELGEIESALRTHTQVSEALVVEKGEGEEKQLNAYVVAAQEEPQPPIELGVTLKAALAAQLPEYMVPQTVMVLDTFPLTPNGKVNRAKLPEPERHNYTLQDYIAPRTSLEESLVTIWQEALSLAEPPSITDNFFDLGGHSLLSAKVVSLIEEKLGYKVLLKQFFHRPTIEAIALSIEQLGIDLKVSEEKQEPEQNSIRWPLPDSLQHKQESYVCSWQGERASSESLILGRNLNDTCPPLFWVFQGDQEFSQLAKYLGDSQPLYGMRSGHLIMDYQEDDIQAFALRYVAEIECLYPTGPLFMGGNCQGGIIALAIAQHLLRRQRIIPLTFLMEWMFGAQPYLGSVAFLSGQKSELNPYLNFCSPHLLWQRSFPDYRIEMIPGGHGQFFIEPNIQGLSSTISRCIENAIKKPPYFIPTIERKVEITVSNLPEIFISEGRYLLAIKLRNASSITWMATETSGLMLANQWLDTENKFITRQDGRSPIPSLRSGESTQLYLPIKVPQYNGIVNLNITVVEEGVGWFKGEEQGEVQLKVNITSPRPRNFPVFSANITQHGSPLLIGGTGGSGTRIVAKILADAGIFLGKQSESGDNLGMIGTWSGSLLPYWNTSLPNAMEADIRHNLEETLNDFLALRDIPKTPMGWGWKLPPHVFFIPFLHQIWPTLRCIHIVRDGRDMALSDNQNQLNYLGPIVLSADELILPSEQRSIRLWECLNISLAEYAARHLPNQYLRLNYEDLCHSPHASLSRLFNFLGIKEDCAPYVQRIRASSQLDRWKQQPEDIKNILNSQGKKGLDYFGYTSESG